MEKREVVGRARARRPLGPRLGWAAALALVLLGGCMPLVSHGPRVEPGVWTGTTGGLGFGPGLEEEVETVLGSYAVRSTSGFFLRHGWVDEGGSISGVLVGLHLPFVIPLSVVHPELDVYAQFTARQSPLQAGSGILAAPSYLMPYAQLGAEIGETEWYTTQGLAVFGYGGGGPDALLWTPTLTLRRRARPDPEAPDAPRPASHYFIQVAVGREWGVEGEREVRRITLGIAREAPGLPRLPGLSAPR